MTPSHSRVELAPAGDAVDVDRHRAGGQLQEFVPGPALLLLDGAEDAQVPGLGIELGRRSIGEDGEFLGQRLAGGQAAGGAHFAFFLRRLSWDMDVSWIRFS